MSDYVNQAKKFLESCDATMNFMYLGTEVNKDWNETRERDTYMVNIRTPLGNMQVKFYDCIKNTLKNEDRYLSGLKKKIQITEYDVLSCLQKYDVGDIEDFIWEFGYEIKEKGDLRRIQNIYNAVKKEYKDVCRCFTPRQIKRMQEIQ